MGVIDFDLNFRDDKGDVTFGNLIETIRDVESRYSRSLTQYIKRSMIASRVFIQRGVSDEQILPDLLLTIQNMYIGWVMTAMNMSAYVDSSRTVNKMLDVVATENITPHKDTDDLLAGLANYNHQKMSIIKESSAVSKGTGAQVVNLPDKLNLPSGRLVELKFHVGGDPKNVLSVEVFVQLLPTFIPDSVAESFFATNFKPDFSKRWFQVTTGEKRFIKDFLFELDQLKRRKKALQEDKTGILKEMFDRQRNGLLNYLLKLAGVYPEKQNVANTVHIYEKTEFDKWCLAHNCDFRKMDHRQKFMNRTFSVMVAVIDAAYGRVDMYFHGINNRGEYAFSQLQQQAKTEKYDLQSIMKAYYNTTAPKF